MEFIIEFKTATQSHAAGEQLKLAVDSVQIGRDIDCQVRFDDSTPTVSRKHAKIEREGIRYKVIALSQTNATYVNGSPIKGDFYLNSGDEIKFSSQGPTIIFRQSTVATSATQTSVNAPAATKASTTSNKPAPVQTKSNKTLYGVIAAVAALLVVGIVLWMNKTPDTSPAQPQAITQNIKECYSSIYFVKVNDISVFDKNHNLVFTYNTEDQYCGTGFMTNTGKFIAARRVVEPWTYNDSGLVGYDQDNRAWNYGDLSSLGYDIVTNCTAFTSAGTSFQFRNTDCKKPDFISMQTDWLSLPKADQLSVVSGLTIDSAWGNNPKYGVECSLVGYKKNTDIQNLRVSNFPNAINVSELNKDKVIELSSRRWEDGMSGAPALIQKDGRWVVIGILSNSYNNQRDIVIPIGNVQ